jgi:uncharacterized membrane protein
LVRPDETSPPNAPGAPKGLAAPVVATARSVSASAPAGGTERKTSFAEDFRRFFIGGLKTLLPTLITLWLLFWIWNFLWENIGRHVIWAIKWAWITLQDTDFLPRTAYEPAGRVRQILDEDSFGVRLLGVGLAILLVYIVGVFVGNLLGRAAWRLIERNVMRLPLIRAIYPSVKQVTDFVLADRSGRAAAGAGGVQFQGSRVVAVQARHQGVWSIGLVTNKGYGPLNEAIQGDMLTVFIPSSPTAVAGYVVVAHREDVVELPLTVEEALRLLVSGGVLVPPAAGAGAPGPTPTAADLLPAPGMESPATAGTTAAPPVDEVEASRSMRSSSAGNPSAA